MDVYNQQSSGTNIENNGSSTSHAYVSGQKHACDNLYLNYMTPTSASTNSLLKLKLNSAEIETTVRSCGEHGYNVGFKGYEGVPYSAAAPCMTIVGLGAKVSHISKSAASEIWWADAYKTAGEQWIEFVILIPDGFECAGNARTLFIELSKFIAFSNTDE